MWSRASSGDMVDGDSGRNECEPDGTLRAHRYPSLLRQTTEPSFIRRALRRLAQAPPLPAAPPLAATARGFCARHGQSLPPLDRLIALADLYGLTPAALLARHATAVSLIAAIDRAEEAAIARLAALLHASDNGL